MRTFLIAALFAAGVGLSWADDPKPADAKKTDDAKAATAKDKLADLQKTLRADMTAWSKDYSAAKPDERAKMMEKRMDLLHEAGKKALAIAKDNLKDEAAMDAIVMALQTGSDKTQTAASDLIVESFADDVKVVKVLPQLADGPNGAKLLQKIADKSKNKDVKGTALYSMIDSEIEAADAPAGKAAGVKDATEKFRAIEAKIDGIIADYGDVKVSAGRKESTIADAAKKQKFFLNNLVVGKTMPDVETELLDGKKTKISDYRGKVVVLDIWATWCGPCRAMIPHEREMVEKRKDKKFVLISVSADDKKETLEKFLEKEEMPWTHWWDGRGGKLTETLQVRYFPTIYVLDEKGVIRFKHVRGAAMDKAVDELLEKMGGAQ